MAGLTILNSEAEYAHHYTQKQADAGARSVLIRKGEILSTYIKVDASTLSRWISKGKFPAPLYLPSGKPVWRRDVVESWVESLPRTEKPRIGGE